MLMADITYLYIYTAERTSVSTLSQLESLRISFLPTTAREKMLIRRAQADIDFCGRGCDGFGKQLLIPSSAEVLSNLD
jgi:hypothetical protein